MLKTPEEHLRLSFSHIMKHWKKTNLPGSKTQGRSVYLRYYAPVPNAKGKTELLLCVVATWKSMVDVFVSYVNNVDLTAEIGCRCTEAKKRRPARV